MDDDSGRRTVDDGPRSMVHGLWSALDSSVARLALSD